jgi:N utilization substance protein B
MLSRRQIRIKVLKSLYSFFQADKHDLAVAERELFRSIDKANELYIFLLLFILELADADQNDAGDLHLKFFPREEELKASRRLFELAFIKELGASKALRTEESRTKLSWQKNPDLVRKIFLEIKKSELFRNFLKDEKADEKEFLFNVVKNFIESSEALQNFIEEESIFWSDDFDFAIHLVLKTIRVFYESNRFELIPLYKDEQDDKEFARKLFSQTILHNKEFEKSISDRTKNWEVERIALMDILILKMALAELISFPNIPVKVSINEFIDISKEYSTPKSKHFVNGVLDKLAGDYKEQGKIVKAGRGLID